MSIPLYHMQMRSSAVESMPRSIPQIGALWDMWERFPDSANPQIRVVAKTDSVRLQDWADTKVKPLSHVERIRPAEELNIAGQRYASVDKNRYGNKVLCLLRSFCVFLTKSFELQSL